MIQTTQLFSNFPASPQFSRHPTPTELQRVSFHLASENESSESNSFTEFSGLEMPTYLLPELNSNGYENRTSTNALLNTGWEVM